MRHRDNYNPNDFVYCQTENKVEDLYKSKYGKYYINQDYFSIIDNEFKAYWLGFLYADGCVTIKTPKTGKKRFALSVGLCLEDKNHLKKFLDSIQSNAPIGEYSSFMNNKRYYNAKICITNKKIVCDLNNCGCVPNKTYSIKFPTETILPKEFLRHFIRGYFDGDGGITINHQKRFININFTGAKEMLETIHSVLINEAQMTNHTNPIVKSDKGDVYSMHWGSLIDGKKFFQYLYKDANIFLDRKFAKFDTLFCLDV